MSRRFLARIACAFVVLALAAAEARADARYWINTNGLFSNVTNWSATQGGPGGASIPGAIDNIVFYRNDSYAVWFTNAVTNSGMYVYDGNVTFVLSGFTHTLGGFLSIGNASGPTPLMHHALTDGDNVWGIRDWRSTVSTRHVGRSRAEASLFIGTEVRR
jgi:hypothetical protein